VNCWSEAAAGEPAPAAQPAGMIFPPAPPAAGRRL